MVFVVDPHSGVPVYRQVMGQVKFLISGGILSAGDELPSTRVLSAQLGVNPTAVSKAYGRLARQGIIQRRYGRPVVLRAPEDAAGAADSGRPLPHLDERERVRARLGCANSEAAKVLSDPLVEQCIEQFASIRHRSLEQDLERASHIQEVLLPPQDLEARGWRAAYHYAAFGPTGGDYCDLVNAGDGDLYFVLGDVMGKGFAASLLMSHLHASFRTLITMGIPLKEMMTRVSRIFREATPDNYFATLICGRAGASGDVEVCNAGHPAPLLLSAGEVIEIEATGLPIGLFPDQEFSTFDRFLEEGDTILAYSDGVTETRDCAGQEYGARRLVACLRENRALPADKLIEACRADVSGFRSRIPQADDLTILAINRSHDTSPARTSPDRTGASVLKGMSSC